ncbi:hypothetical protein KEM48_004676 [Puccinia striiformis f. sp. tritici PST-130]|nr:hypothetical protein KEM48_004676 [Puccinia striiformis f. sp. tritici PST-130]
MRTRLRRPEIFLATVEEVDELMNSIVAESARLSDQLVELTGAGLLGTGIGTDEEEEKLRLLLWDAKSKLFVEAVHLQAEREPLNNSHILGSHLGTKGKENIIKALQNRSGAVKKLITSFNRLYSTLQEKFPNHRLITKLGLGDLRRVEKLNLIKQELIRSTSEHANLVLDWNDNITWLWKRCQPTGNDIHFQQWLDLVEKANQSQVSTHHPHANDVDDWIEEAVLDEEVDDGDDAEAYLIYQFEGLSNNDHAESRPAPAVDDQVLAINNQLANSPVTVA